MFIQPLNFFQKFNWFIQKPNCFFRRYFINMNQVDVNWRWDKRLKRRSAIDLFKKFIIRSFYLIWVELKIFIAKYSISNPQSFQKYNHQQKKQPFRFFDKLWSSVSGCFKQVPGEMQHWKNISNSPFTFRFFFLNNIFSFLRIKPPFLN